jgi:hypothetical protein
MPLQARSQQTPWAHVSPLWHMSLLLQDPPSGTLPQLFPTQVFGGVH